MYLCLCNGITLEMAKKAAKKGCPPQELAKKLGVGSDCGTCLMSALQDLEKNLFTKKSAEKCCQISQKAS